MYKKLLATGLSFAVSVSSIFGMTDVLSTNFTEIEYDRPLIAYPEKLGTLGFAYIDGIYYIEQEGEVHVVQNAFVDKKLRGMSEEQLLKFWEGGYIAINKHKDGDDFYLTAKTRGLGGGGLGAMWGAIAGKFVVHAIGGAIAGAAGLVVTPFVGPVGGAAVASGVWGVMAPTVEVTSTAIALAGGIAGGVVTGPV